MIIVAVLLGSAWVTIGVISAFIMRMIDIYHLPTDQGNYWIKNRPSLVVLYVFAAPIAPILAMFAVMSWCTDSEKNVK